MFNFRDELNKVVVSKKVNPIINGMAEKILRELLQGLENCDSQKLSKAEKIKFMCTEKSIIAYVYDDLSGKFSTFSSIKEYNKDVFEEIRRILRYEKLIDESSEKENEFSIILP